MSNKLTDDNSVKWCVILLKLFRFIGNLVRKLKKSSN